MEEGDLRSSSVNVDATETSSLMQFRDAVRSANVLAMVRETLAVLFGVAAPMVDSIAADVERQVLHVEVTGGQRGVEQLRAACALIQSIDGANSALPKGRVPVRLTLQRVAHQ